MNIKELEKIIFNLRKYDLMSEIPDIRKWLLSLNDKQINNFLKLDIKLNNFLSNNKKIIINSDFLISDFYIQHLQLLSKTNNNEVIYALLNIIFHNNENKNKDYIECLKLLLKTDDPIKIWCIKNLMINDKIIYLDYLYEILNIIYEEDTFNAYLIYLFVSKNYSLSYEKITDMINNLKKEKDDDVIIYNGKDSFKKNLKIKNEDDIYEMLFKVNAYTDDDKKDVTRLILK